MFTFSIFFLWCFEVQLHFSLEFTSILLGVIIIEIFICQIGGFSYEYCKYKKALHDNWKVLQAPKKCKTGSVVPKFISSISFKFRVVIFEPLFFYHIIYHFSLIKAGWNSAVENKHYFTDLIDHDAIIVNIYSKFGKEYIFGDGIDLLVNFFIERKIPFKVYCCYNSQNFFEIVNKPKCKNLWIFGHGNRGGIASSDKYTDYFELVNKMSLESLSKSYIYQFHCNGGCKKSLADYLSNGRGFANYKYLDKGGEVRGYIENILHDESWGKN